MSNSLLESVEDYIWDQVDEAEYLRRVVEDKHADLDALANKVRFIQSDLHIQLRKGVEENYPKLLEQVGAIESLDRVQSGFDEEMRLVQRKARNVKEFFAQSFEQLKLHSNSMEKLVLLQRIVQDALRCEQLVVLWEKNEHDLLVRSECISELKLICSENQIFQSIKWIKEGFLKKVPSMATVTSQTAVAELKQALLSLNALQVSSCLKSLSLLFDTEEYTKEIRLIMDEALQSMEGLFLNLSASKSSDVISRQLPRIGNKLHTYLEQFQLLGVENALYFSNKVSVILRNRVPSDTENTVRLVQTINKCLLPHAEAIVKPIKDALGPLKTAILSQSLARMFEIVNDTFVQEDIKGAVIVEKLNGTLKAEISNFNWDPELQKQIEGNIFKTMQIIAAKIEEQMVVSPEVLRLSGRVSKLQGANYQLLSAAHAFRKQWPLYSECLRLFIDSQLKVIVDTMNSTISLVLDSMHEEDLQKELPQQAPCSLYMGEVCDHLKVFKVHINQIDPFAESLETLPNFINFIIEQFILNATLVKPFNDSIRTRFVKDFGSLCKALQSLNCISSKYLNSQKSITKLLEVPIEDFSSFEKQLPPWFLILTQISSSSDLPLPYESTGWSRKEFIDWFRIHSDSDRLNFLLNMVKAFEHERSSIEPSVVYLKRFIENSIDSTNN